MQISKNKAPKIVHHPMETGTAPDFDRLMKAVNAQPFDCQIAYFKEGETQVEIGLGQLFKEGVSFDLDHLETLQVARMALAGKKPRAYSLIPYDQAKALVLGTAPERGITTIMPELVIFYDLESGRVQGEAYGLVGDAGDLGAEWDENDESDKRLKGLVGSYLDVIARARGEATSEVEVGVGMEREAAGPLIFKPHLDPEAYGKRFFQVQDKLRSGHIFQLVLANTFEAQGALEPDLLFCHLVKERASPFVLLFKTPKETLISATPERLVSNVGGQLETVPIAGTRPVLRDGLDDARAKSLLDDPKERSEHLMLVDLGRNDLGRVCVPGSVKVKDYATVKKLSRVMHLVSRVVGTMDPKARYLDPLRATFPAGTVSGAPKRSAMGLIETLEGRDRGAYAGCFLIEDMEGSYDSLIAIRTLVQSKDTLSLTVGSGIVLDSTLKGEAEELYHKAQGQIQAIAAVTKKEVTLDFNYR